MSAISVGARLDRLPVTRLHRKVFNLVAVGMFFEGFDIYIAASVLGATYKTGFSTLAQNGLFISMTFVGMTLGALLTGFLGEECAQRHSDECHRNEQTVLRQSREAGLVCRAEHARRDVDIEPLEEHSHRDQVEHL